MNLLSRMVPTAELLAQLPELAATQWQARKARISADARTLASSLANEKTLHQRAIMAKLNGTLSADEFDSVKTTITEKISSLEAQINALDSERSTMEDLLAQTQAQVVDLVGAWEKGNVNQRQELATSFFPDGLVFSHELGFFEPARAFLLFM